MPKKQLPDKIETSSLYLAGTAQGAGEPYACRVVFEVCGTLSDPVMYHIADEFGEGCHQCCSSVPGKELLRAIERAREQGLRDITVAASRTVQHGVSTIIPSVMGNLYLEVAQKRDELVEATVPWRPLLRFLQQKLKK